MRLMSRASVSKRVSVPENFTYFPSGGNISLQMQLAHHRLNQKRQILQKQRYSYGEGNLTARRHNRSQNYAKPYLPTDSLNGPIQGSDFLFQPIAEDEPTFDNSLMTANTLEVSQSTHTLFSLKITVDLFSEFLTLFI